MVYSKIQDFKYNIYEKINRCKMNDYSNQLQISVKDPPMSVIKGLRHNPLPDKQQNPFTIEVKKKQTEAENAARISIRLYSSNQDLKWYLKRGVDLEWNNLNAYIKAHYQQLTDQNAQQYWLTMIPESYHESLLAGEIKRLDLLCKATHGPEETEEEKNKREETIKQKEKLELWLLQNYNMSPAQQIHDYPDWKDNWKGLLQQFIANRQTLLHIAWEKLKRKIAEISKIAKENERLCDELEKLVKGGIVPRVNAVYQRDENGRIMEQENGLPIGLGTYTQDSSVQDKAEMRIQESKALRESETRLQEENDRILREMIAFSENQKLFISLGLIV